MEEEKRTCNRCQYFQYAFQESNERNKIVGRCQNKEMMQGGIIMVYCEDLLVSGEFGCLFFKG